MSRDNFLYLENVFLVSFQGNLNELVKHGLRALRETLPAEQDLTTKVGTRFS